MIKLINIDKKLNKISSHNKMAYQLILNLNNKNHIKISITILK